MTERETETQRLWFYSKYVNHLLFTSFVQNPTTVVSAKYPIASILRASSKFGLDPLLIGALSPWRPIQYIQWELDRCIYNLQLHPKSLEYFQSLVGDTEVVLTCSDSEPWSDPRWSGQTHRADSGDKTRPTDHTGRSKLAGWGIALKIVNQTGLETGIREGHLWHQPSSSILRRSSSVADCSSNSRWISLVR